MSIILFIIAFSVIVLFIIIEPFNDWSLYRDSLLFSQYGNFIGGLAGSLISIGAGILLYSTLVETRKSSSLESFENSFFNLLRIQKELVDTINVEITGNNTKTTIKGRDFFNYATQQIGLIYEAINFKEYVSENYNFLDCENDYNITSQGNIAEYPEFELTKTGEIKARISSTVKKYKIEEKRWLKANNKKTFEKVKASYAYFFQYYHHAIGHYFRHLYHIVKFVNEAGVLKKQRKKKIRYIGFVQAQMSSFELALTYYNISCYPNMLNLSKDLNLLENINISDLCDDEHYCIEGIKLKDKKNLLAFLDE